MLCYNLYSKSVPWQCVRCVNIRMNKLHLLCDLKENLNSNINMIQIILNHLEVSSVSFFQKCCPLCKEDKVLSESSSATYRQVT